MTQVENMYKLLINAVCCSIIESKDIVQSLFLMKRKIYCIDMYNRIFGQLKIDMKKLKRDRNTAKGLTLLVIEENSEEQNEKIIVFSL